MLEPCAVKVASTVLRRGSHREMGLLSDENIQTTLIYARSDEESMIRAVV